MKTWSGRLGVGIKQWNNKFIDFLKSNNVPYSVSALLIIIHLPILIGMLQFLWLLHILFLCPCSSTCPSTHQSAYLHFWNSIDYSYHPGHQLSLPYQVWIISQIHGIKQNYQFSSIVADVTKLMANYILQKLICYNLSFFFLHLKCIAYAGILTPGGRLNKKDGLTRYGDSHV